MQSMNKAKTIRILGIETSCDETSVALLEFKIQNSKFKILKHLIATQIPVHARYGGVVPEVAARMHVAETVSLLDKTLGWSGAKSEKRKAKSAFDAIAVTQGPGLATALRVGLDAAKTLSWVYGKPLHGINHLEGHMASAWLVPANRKNWKFPILFLLVSGGHSELVLMTDFGKYKVLGRTRDDAAGEAFDKTAKMLGLEYPGGPKLSKLAEKGNPKAFDLPRPMLHDPSLDFSFSGLKTAVRQLVESSTYNVQRTTSTPRGTKYEVRGTIEDVCASIQAAIVETLVSKTIRAALKVKPKAVAVVGGVSANPKLKADLKVALKKNCPGIKLLAPAKGLYTDNGAMIAAAGYWQILSKRKPTSIKNIDAQPDLDL
ncbi:MAG: tRNA (adenosine(37)-N6)-threonylcarbamoyltransferase complex transferase subunit TsaD [Patescibacteria group bacterium]